MFNVIDTAEGITKVFRSNIDGEPGKQLSEFLEMLDEEQEAYGGISSLKEIIEELLSQGYGKPTLHASDFEAYLFSPQLNPGVQEHACGESSRASSSKLTMKVKVYMGQGWKHDLPNLDFFSPPDLYVKVWIRSRDRVETTKIVKNEWEPKWGEEFSFMLVDRETDILEIQVFDHDTCKQDDFAGKRCLPIAQFRWGTRAVALTDISGKYFGAISLLMRFT